MISLNLNANVSIKIKEKYLRLNYLSSSFSFLGVSGTFATLDKSERSFFLTSKSFLCVRFHLGSRRRRSRPVSHRVSHPVPYRVLYRKLEGKPV